MYTTVGKYQHALHFVLSRTNIGHITLVNQYIPQIIKPKLKSISKYLSSKVARANNSRCKSILLEVS